MSVLKGFLQLIWRALDGLRKVLHLIVLLLLFAVLIAVLSPRIPVVPSRAALVLTPQGALVEQLSGDPWERALEEASGQRRNETVVRDLVEVIDTARQDDRIVALVLDLGSMSSGGLPKLEEIARAIDEFRDTGKPVIALGEAYTQGQYYLAAHADEIYLDPMGAVFIEGFGYYRAYLRDAIDKLALDVNVFQAGRFKSAPDQFNRSDMSDPEREESRVWLEALWSSYQAAVTSARGLDGGAVRDYVDGLLDDLRENTGDFATVALERNLVTELRTRSEVEQRLVALTGEDSDTGSFIGVGNDDYLLAHRSQQALVPSADDRIGVVSVAGEIVDGESLPGMAGGDTLANLLEQARLDESTRAVVLRIDSPGGSVFASEVIRREVEALREAGKPVVASMSSTAASGGYQVAMSADQIWASPNTLTGSIGVFAIFPTAERSLGKLGVHVDGLGTTPYAGAFRLDRTLGESPREVIQLSVDRYYLDFVQDVAAARGKPLQTIEEIAQGRVWVGSDALRLGLVDSAGLVADAIAAAANLAGLGQDYDVEYLQPELTWRQALALRVQALATRAIRALVPEGTLGLRVRVAIAPLEGELLQLARLIQRGGVYYYCPCQVD